jgi:peptidoglycan L-alanyl-D-glutamate endopeptidase CwlK
MKANIGRLIKLWAVLAVLQLGACAQSRVPKPLDSQKVVVDSALSFTEAVGDQNAPDHIKSDLSLVTVRYYAFDGKVHQGQLVIHKNLQKDIIEIFAELERVRFPIAKVFPISKYNFSDRLSMLDNNSSGFNYRLVAGTSSPSNHAFGRAIDVNPFLNPYIRDGIVEPDGAVYDPKVPGTVVAGGIVVKLFKERGWTWGGDWNTVKDYQHFEKPN